MWKGFWCRGWRARLGQVVLVGLRWDGVFDVEVPWNAVTERGALPLFKGGHFLRSGREPAVPVVEVGLSLRVAAAAA